MAAETIADRLERLIGESGPIPVSTYVEHALYGPDGFYMAGGRAGRRGDFLTAPETGPLFGRVVASALDAWWREAEQPSEFVVHEWGAGPGTLARAVLAASPEVLVAGALRWYLVERSAEQRTRHPRHERFHSVEGAPVHPADVVLANELLDNLPFEIYERGTDERGTDDQAGAAWHRLLVDRRGDDCRFQLVRDPADPASGPPELTGLAGSAEIAAGVRVPVQRAAGEWLAAVTSADPGSSRRIVVFDYGADTTELASRDGGWLRTHRDHGQAADWLRSPGSCDITTDVAFDQLALVRTPARDLRQDEWLRIHGIEAIVEDGRRQWQERTGAIDLSVLEARSRVIEAEALLDPAGMGAFRVLEWRVP